MHALVQSKCSPFTLTGIKISDFQDFTGIKSSLVTDWSWTVFNTKSSLVRESNLRSICVVKHITTVVYIWTRGEALHWYQNKCQLVCISELEVKLFTGIKISVFEEFTGIKINVFEEVLLHWYQNKCFRGIHWYQNKCLRGIKISHSFLFGESKISNSSFFGESKSSPLPSIHNTKPPIHCQKRCVLNLVDTMEEE